MRPIVQPQSDRDSGFVKRSGFVGCSRTAKPDIRVAVFGTDRIVPNAQRLAKLIQKTQRWGTRRSTVGVDARRLARRHSMSNLSGGFGTDGGRLHPPEFRQPISPGQPPPSGEKRGPPRGHRGSLMHASILASRATSLNAKVGGVAMAAAAFLTLLLSHFSTPLAPLRLLVLAVAAFAAWSLCDEMGMRKPLNRAGFVFFAIALTAKVQLTIGVTPERCGPLLPSLRCIRSCSAALWSVAFRRRQRTLKSLPIQTSRHP